MIRREKDGAECDAVAGVRAEPRRWALHSVIVKGARSRTHEKSKKHARSHAIGGIPASVFARRSSRIFPGPAAPVIGPTFSLLGPGGDLSLGSIFLR